MPGAAYMVSNMSSTNVRSGLLIVFTGSDLNLSRLSGMTRMSRRAMRAM